MLPLTMQRRGTVKTADDWSALNLRIYNMRKTILTVLMAAMLAGTSVGAAFAQGSGGGAGGSLAPGPHSFLQNDAPGLERIQAMREMS